ncbi:MAG: sigma-70 family RNA polymerase sigma factor [Elusimicrobia bacterium]|nr:sigma-70 family RNA polymerase sigma factor [Elusimicrobiota bacterium]MDE2237167.1 sigma-70 family RNA polymerase sigma factor [Elusimicrobiota bacterium]MDE2424505.1 sigma-70 family RNA polymerase sigma factor [Elusimicrobiota bacterium]
MTPAAFEELLREHWDSVERFVWTLSCARGLEAEDLAQEVWVQAYRSIDRFEGRSAARTWLYGICRNVCLAWARRRSQTLSLDESAESGETTWPDGEPEPLERLLREESTGLVRRCLEALPAGQRAALVLREWEGLSYEEIAEALDVPLGTVRSRLHNAMAGLARLMRGALRGQTP